MKLKIVSDGTPTGTFVYGQDTDGDWHAIERVSHVRWEHEAGKVPHATIELVGPEIAASFEGSPTRKDARDDFTAIADDDIPF